MNSQNFSFNLGIISQSPQSLSQDQFRENYGVNKDSVNTSIGHDQKENEAKFKNSIKAKNQPLDIKKTKFIWKPQIKKAAPILKHKKVVQTLRNITKNIKNQLSTLNKSKLQTPNKKIKNNERLQMEEENQHKLQPQIKQIQSKSQKKDQKGNYGPSNNVMNEQMEIQTKELLEQFAHQRQVALEQQTNPKAKQENLSPHKNEINLKRPQHVLLYSKYKGIAESFPVYEDCMLSDKKEFRNLTIHREYDNDVDSDQQQIQMGVGFMYQQLMHSCHKYSEMKQQKLLLVQSSHAKRHKHAKDHIPLEKVKQKLVFR